MTTYSSVTAFLAEIGGACTLETLQEGLPSSEWRLGNEILVVAGRPGGAVRVARVVIESAVVDRILDTLGEFHVRRIGAVPGSLGIPPR